MKRFVKTALIAAFIILIFSINTFAEQMPGDDYSKIIGEIDSSTRELLTDSGIEDVSFDELYSLSPRKIINVFLGLIKGNISKPLQTSGFILCLAVLSCIVKSFSGNKLSENSVFSFAQSAVIIISVTVPFSQAVIACGSAVKTLSDFMLIYIPVFTGVVSASGQPMTSFTYSASMIAFAQFCQKSFEIYIIPLIGAMTVVNITTLINSDINAVEITKLIKKVITVALTVISGVFSGLLSLKANLAVASDSVAIKGIKLLSGSVIPFVGGSIGEAYTSVLGAFGLIKSTVGVFGIIVIFLIVLPPLINNLIWYFALSFCSLISSALGDKLSKNMLDALVSCLSLINIVTLFSAVIFTVSTGIMLNLRG